MKERGRGVSAQLNSSANSAITQPVQGRNVRRTQQIKALHSEFQDLKKKIKDVENKNEKIIENIHKQYDFKKKPQHPEYTGDTPVVYYRQREEKTTERSGRKSERQLENIESEDRETRLQNKRGSNSKKNVASGYTQNVQSARRQSREQSEMVSSKISNPLVRQPTPMTSNNQIGLNASSQLSVLSGDIPQESIQISPFAGLGNYPMSMQFPAYTATFPNMSMGQMPVYNQGYVSAANFQFEDQLRREREKIKVLQKQLQNRDQESTSLRRLQKRHGVLTVVLSEEVEGMLQIFMEEVIKKKLYEIEKYVKKNDNKLKRLQMELKDREEEYVSKRNIEVNRMRRQHSKSKRALSPKGGNYDSIVSGQRISGRKRDVVQGSPPNVKSTSKSKQSEISKSNQQFSVIASGYEQMIKVKNREIEILQKKLKQREKELMEVSGKCAKLESRIVDLAQIPKDTRQRKYSEKQDNLLANFEFDEGKEEEIKTLNQKVVELEEMLRSKAVQLRERETVTDKITKKAADYEGKAKKMQAELSKLREESRRQSISGKLQSDSQPKIKRLESELQIKQKQWSAIRERCSKIESEKIERECQNLTLGNRLGKMQNLLSVKQSKIEQLQRIIESSSGNDIGDLLEKSVYFEKFDPNEIHKMQEEKERLEEETSSQREEIYLLRRNHQTAENRCNQLVAMVETMKRQNQSLTVENANIRSSLQEREAQQYEVRVLRPRMFSESDRASEGEEDHAVREELEELRGKYEETQRALKIQKHESLESTTKVIKLSSEVSYYRQLLSERQSRYQKLRREFEEGRVQSSQLKKALESNQEALQVQRRANMQKIKEIESQWLQFQQEMRGKQQVNEEGESPNEVMRNSRLSEESFANYKSSFNSISVQNEQLNERVKEQQKMIEVQREMEGKIINEYRENIEKIKLELREKSRQNEQLAEEMEGCKRKLRSMEQGQTKAREKSSAESRLQQVAAQCNQRMVELQAQLKEVRSMQQQLFLQLSAKQQQHQSLLRVLQGKEGKIQQLQEIIELKELNFNSHISSSMHKSKLRDSLQSQSSLRYSVVSVNKDRTMQLDLSEVGQSFFEGNQSMISNVSQVFAKEEFPYEKVQLKRVQQRRLFEKTAAYIKSLKTAIDEKDKRIKLLQRKIESLRNSELVRKDIYDVKESGQESPQEYFQECMSVQLQRSNSQRYRYKQLEHEAKLTIEENNLLNNQIENLEDELTKAEEQENSLMKLKDLYKEEIKSLIKQNQQQANSFETELKHERQRNEESQSVQRMQAIRQLYLKIMAVIIAIDHEVPKAKRREERHRELQDYIKVFCNLLNLQPAVRDRFLSDLKK